MLQIDSQNINLGVQKPGWKIDYKKRIPATFRAFGSGEVNLSSKKPR